VRGFPAARQRASSSDGLLMDLVWMVVLGLAGITSRFYNIAEPHYVCFDEVHFGNFASLYLKVC
jgi:dolichyl-phosphate-mannose--protein O-mannosyl transferase